MLQADRERRMTMQEKRQEYTFRLRFERKGAIVYTGHLDLMRACERTLRRAEIPVMYSRGYNPRPLMVFALPLGVGIATVDDYADVSLRDPIDTNELVRLFNLKSPPGLRAISVRDVTGEKASIMSLVSAASYRLEGPGIGQAIRNIAKLERIPAIKHAKGKETQTDLRPLLFETDTPEGRDGPVEILVKAGSAGNLRPDLLLSACVEFSLLDQRTAQNTEVTRTGLFGGKYPDLTRLGEL